MQTVQNYEDLWNEAKSVKDFTEGESPDFKMAARTTVNRKQLDMVGG